MKIKFLENLPGKYCTNTYIGVGFSVFVWFYSDKKLKRV